MECHKTHPGLDTVLILNCEEEILSEKLTKDSSLDTIILNNEEELKPKKQRRHYKNKSEHRRRRHSEHGKKNTESARTKFVTQEIHVEKQNFKYIINLNTTVCDHSNSHKRSCDTKCSKEPISKHKGRTVPHCLRPLCRHPRHYETRFGRHSKEHCRASLHRQTKDLNKSHECMKETKHGKQKCRHSRHEKKTRKKKQMTKQNEQKLISLTKKLKSEYEDISNTSLDRYLEIPSSYKHVVKNSREEEHQSKLDTLIKRTKERERKLVAESRNIPWNTSTPYAEASSIEFPISCSEIDLSLHSRSTLVLEPRDHVYSPSIEGLSRSPVQRYLQYSPISSDEDYFPNYLEKRDFELKIKHEPTMDAEAYSPTQEPIQKLFEVKEQSIKKEIKAELSIKGLRSKTL